MDAAEVGGAHPYGTREGDAIGDPLFERQSLAQIQSTPDSGWTI